jgi:hypothetical protein
MGSCFSCRRRVRRSEREPLLPKNTSSDLLPPPTSNLDKIADVLAALGAGKIPSQAQLDGALRTLLKSDLLRADAGKTTFAGSGYGSLGAARNSLSPNGGLILDDVRAIAQAMLELGMQKNGKLGHRSNAYHITYLLRY